VVYVENRNGNSDAQTLQQDTLQRLFEQLKNQHISIDNFRADGASYQLSTLHVISDNCKRFYIRTRMSQTLHHAIEQISNWKQIKIGNEIAYRGDTIFAPFASIAKREKKEHLLKSYRLVVTKINRNDRQVNMFTKEACNYFGILTNDEEMTNDQIVCFYNKRGAMEKEFDVLKNDFGWNNMPFSNLSDNTVFLIVMAIARNLYEYIIHVFSQRFNFLAPSFRIKKFIFRFICIPAKWIKHARYNYLKIYGEMAFKT